MIDEILLFLAKKVGHAGGGEHIYIYIVQSHYEHWLKVQSHSRRPLNGGNSVAGRPIT